MLLLFLKEILHVSSFCVGTQCSYLHWVGWEGVSCRSVLSQAVRGLVKVLDVTYSRELDATKECQSRRYEYFLPFATLLPTIQDGHHPVTNSGSNDCVQMEEGCWHYTVGSRVAGRFGLRAWPHQKAPKTPWYVCAGDSITVDARLCRDDMTFLRVSLHTHSLGYDCVRKRAVSFP